MVLEGACIFLNKKQHYQHHQHLSRYMWNENIKPIAHDAYLSIFTLHLKLPTQTSKKKSCSVQSHPRSSELNHHFTLKKSPVLCIYPDIFPCHTLQTLQNKCFKYVPVEKKGNTEFLWVSHGGSKACCLYIIQIYMNSIYLHRISLKITGHASSGFLRRGAAARYGLVMSERWRDLGKSSSFGYGSTPIGPIPYLF